MQQDDIRPLASRVLSLINENLTEISFLSKGATSSIWLVKSKLNSYALRIVDIDERVICGTMDSFIRRAVSIRGGATATPVLHSEMYEPVPGQKRWSLDEYVSGAHPQRGKLSQTVCRDFGKTLAALHDIPVSKCGRPVKIENSTILGEKFNAIEGLMQRFENPIPQTWEPEFIHPVIALKSNMAPAILAQLQEVADIVEERNHVLCHSDLHGKQILCTADQFNALIDFGDATILDRNWDLGSALYFHGIENFREIYSSYTHYTKSTGHGLEVVRSFSIAVAMHHASRSRLPGKGHRLERSASHIMDIIGS